MKNGCFKNSKNGSAVDEALDRMQFMRDLIFDQKAAPVDTRDVPEICEDLRAQLKKDSEE